MYMYIHLLLYFQCLMVGFSEEGDSCQLTTKENGRCVNIRQCPYVITLLKNGKYPKICGFKKSDSLVCCKQENQNLIHLTQKPGKISLKKCEQYYPRGMYGILRTGGKKSLAREFPHMAAIGYGDTGNIQWLCGGSLISMNFVLTAAHCLASVQHGQPRCVRLGELDFATDADIAGPQDFTIVKCILHPNFKPPRRYHDIGLIQLDRAIIRTEFVNIACLDPVREYTVSQMTATGWGRTEFAGDSSKHLLKIDLDITPNSECRKHYVNVPRDLPNGIVDDIFICAGGKEDQDTCQGDSGGPLQVRNIRAGIAVYSYYIVGITSFGKACGVSRSPGIYTRVYNYLSWIENIVWPS